MKEILIAVKFDDDGGYKGHGADTSKLILYEIERYMQIDLEDEKVVKKGWTVELKKINKPG
jgi:hypothetical protein